VKEQKTGKTCDAGIQYKVFAVGPFGVNCIVVYEHAGTLEKKNAETQDNKDRRAVIIDPSDEETRVYDFITKNKLVPEAVLLTHGHLDHIGVSEKFRLKYNIPVYLHPEDNFLNKNFSMQTGGFPAGSMPFMQAEEVTAMPSELRFGNIRFSVLHTPGHSPGSVCFYNTAGKVLFCGDTIFNRGVGRTDLWKGSADVLIRSIKKVVYALPDDVLLMPGHGPESCIGDEKVSNPFTS